MTEMVFGEQQPAWVESRVETLQPVVQKVLLKQFPRIHSGIASLKELKPRGDIAVYVSSSRSNFTKCLS